MSSDVPAFLDAIPDDRRRADAHLLAALMTEVTGEQPALWGSSIVGFGARHYRYESGHEGDTMAVGFAPRKAQSVLYLTGAMADYEDLLAELGPHTTGKGCLYLKRVDQAEPAALREIIARSYRAAATI
jgi:hypothetical protein